MGDEKAFDAAESYLCDRSESSMSKWRTPSLVTALVGILARQPQFEHDSMSGRAAAFNSAAEELTRRGLDALALIRYGMWIQVTGMIFSTLVQSADPTAERPGGLSREDADAWWTALALADRPVWPDTPAPPEVHAFVSKTLVPAIPRLRTWLTTASIDELLELRPPSTAISETVDLGGVRNLDEQYVWAVDHFSRTFYDDWQTSSLHRARRWIDGHEIPPCKPELMEERVIDKAKLDAEIAKRVASSPKRKPRPPQPAISNLLANQMVRYATSLLADRRYRDAAAVFEFAASQEPYNGAFRNNIGFCLIPEDPLEALGHLEAAGELTDSLRTVNIYNRICCHIALHRVREALALADTNWRDIRGRQTRGATLWRRAADSDSWVIFHTDDERAAVAELAIAVAGDEGFIVEEHEWQGRLAELKG